MMIERFNYTPDHNEALSWDELEIGCVFYHRHTHDICIKTSSKAYFCFNDKGYHTRSRLLSDAVQYKNYYQVKCKIEIEL